MCVFINLSMHLHTHTHAHVVRVCVHIHNMCDCAWLKVFFTGTRQSHQCLVIQVYISLLAFFFSLCCCCHHAHARIPWQWIAFTSSHCFFSFASRQTALPISPALLSHQFPSSLTLDSAVISRQVATSGWAGVSESRSRWQPWKRVLARRSSTMIFLLLLLFFYLRISDEETRGSTKVSPPPPQQWYFPYAARVEMKLYSGMFWTAVSSSNDASVLCRSTTLSCENCSVISLSKTAQLLWSCLFMTISYTTNHNTNKPKQHKQFT